MVSIDPKIIVALDFDNCAKAMSLVDQLDAKLCRLKVGKQLFTYGGPAFLEKIVAKGFEVFLDLKFHDIPSTVAKACVAAADIGVWMINVHAQGGLRMMTAAREALDKRGDAPLLVAVTMLTSIDRSDLVRQGNLASPLDYVRRLAEHAKEAALDGVVCSALEASALKAHLGKDFKLVTPGIRLSPGGVDDQRRIVTPKQAIEYGADYLVIGRPITQSIAPATVLDEIIKAIV